MTSENRFRHRLDRDQESASQASSMTEKIETDVLVIGCGVAGATAALELADAGLHVTVATLGRNPKEASTYWAQGGIVFKGKEDSPDLLAKDITHAGAGHCSPAAVRILSENGPRLLQELLIEKTQVDEIDPLLLCQTQHVLGRHVRHLLGRIVDRCL